MAAQGGDVLDDVKPQTLQLIDQISRAFEVAATPYRPDKMPLEGMYRSIFVLSKTGFESRIVTAAAGLQEAAT